MMLMTILNCDDNDNDDNTDDAAVDDHLEELHQPGLVVHCANLLAQHAVEDLEKANYSNLEDPPLDKEGHLGYGEGERGGDEHEELGQQDRACSHCQPVSGADSLTSCGSR